MTDFNTIYEIIAPYLGSSSIALTVIGVLVGFLKLSSAIKNFRDSFKNTSKLIEEGIKKVIPEHLYVKIEGVAKEEFAKMKAEIEKTVDEKWLKQIKQNTELMQAMALALSSMKAIPDSQKKLLAKHLDIKPETTEALVIDLIATEETKPKKVEKILID